MAKLRRFLVEVLAFILCLLIGAAVFHAIEYKNDEPVGHSRPNSSEILDSVVRNISLKYNISARDMNHTVKQLRRRLWKNENKNWDVWDFTGCYFFAGTVAFTIGFGHQTPTTTLGQLMVIIYAMFAIPITGLMLSACGERMAVHQRKAVIFIEKRILKRELKNLHGKTIAMNIFVLMLFFIIGSIMTKYYYDGWSIIEGVYFLWICMSTVGFGDYIINDGKPYYEDDVGRTIMLRFNVIGLIIGLCQVSCILVSIQNALEKKFVERVGDETGETAMEGVNGSGRGENIGQKNEGCALEVVENEQNKTVSGISLNTL
ncbi:potassium channel subfamily K member 2-like [Dendronephthya gigantea]|uniref:potassium channel subfamily K member 2-like n=1 Tax=Dendronephthya gigantea TaxID=151771 RepID=UPI00106C8CE5|nr:potassium channel subfamily K member 2-like [Dendronephthya gigantea]